MKKYLFLLISFLLVLASCEQNSYDSGAFNSEGTADNKTLSAPKNLKAYVNGYEVTLMWDIVKNASYYNVYYSTSLSGEYVLVASEENTYVELYANSAGTYYFTVRAVNSNDEEGPQSMAIYATVSDSGGNSGENTGGDNTGGGNTGGSNTETKPSAPTNVSCQNVGNNYSPTIKITWNDVSNATSYKVYRSSSSSGSYTLLGSTTYAYYTDWEPMNGKNYYKVKAVNSAGESSYSSYTVYTYDTSSSLAPATPTISISGTSTIYLSWSCATGNSYGKPSKYEVYKQDPMDGEYDLLTTTTSTSYSDRDPHPGKNMYVVKAINDAGSSWNYALSSSVPLSKPTSFTATKSGSYVYFTWSKVNHATGYQIFSSSSASGSYSIIKEVTGGSTTSVSVYYPASSGTTVYFKIKAIWESPYGASSFIYSDLTSYKYVTF